MRSDFILEMDFMRNRKITYHFLLIWLFFAIISFSLGYHTINSFIVESIPKNADAYVYKDIVTNGLSAMGSDHRSSRILIPLVAHGVYLLLPEKIGSWDVSLFSLLTVNVILCACIATLIYVLALKQRMTGQASLIAALLFFLNFAVPNYYLASLVDAGECLCMILLALTLMLNGWKYLPMIAIVGVSIKETFFPVATIFAFVWAYMEYKEKGMLRLYVLYCLCAFLAASFLTIVLLKSIAYGQLTYPWEYAKRLYHLYQSFSINYMIDGVRSFLYVFAWLLFFGVQKINHLSRKWVVCSVSSAFVMLFMSFWAGTSGAAISRYLFNVIGPLLCISSSLYLTEWIESFTKKMNIASVDSK